MKKTKFNWKCIHCKKRNITIVPFQFDIPKYYTAEWNCEKCGKFTKISFRFEINYTEDKIRQWQKGNI